MSRTTGKSAKVKRKVKPVSARQMRKSVQRSQIRFRKKTIEVRRPISMRGRTHPMEAPLPGMPETPQALLMDSTAIRRFKYDMDTKILRIWFVSKHVYDYYDVPESVVITLAQAQSKGSFFYYNIRTEYSFRRIR